MEVWDGNYLDKVLAESSSSRETFNIVGLDWSREGDTCQVEIVMEAKYCRYSLALVLPLWRD
jgi:hypothetical protein